MRHSMLTLITGGTVITEGSAQQLDVLVRGSQIESLLEPGTVEARDGSINIDARGLYVLPGLVDAHVHVRDPGYTYKEDFESATRAAAAGGVTSILVMPYDDPVVSDREALRAKKDVARDRMHVDVGLQGAVGMSTVDRLRELHDGGAVSVELLLGVDPAVQLSASSAAEIRAVFSEAAQLGIIIGVSCDDFSLISTREEELRRRGGNDMAAFLESRLESGENLSVAMCCALAHETGAAIHIRQVSTAWSVEIVEHYRSQGADISFEVTPHNLALSSDDALAVGPALKVVPPLRDPATVRSLVQRLREGRIDMIATDHAPHTLDEKTRSSDIWTTPGGLTGLETFLPAVYALLGSDRLGELTRATSERPAARFGLGGRKGRISEGYDADLVLMDPSSSPILDHSALQTKAGAVPFDARHLKGRVVLTLLRGAVVFHDGEVVGEPQGRIIDPVWQGM